MNCQETTPTCYINQVHHLLRQSSLSIILVKQTMKVAFLLPPACGPSMLTVSPAPGSLRWTELPALVQAPLVQPRVLLMYRQLEAQQKLPRKVLGQCQKDQWACRPGAWRSQVQQPCWGRMTCVLRHPLHGGASARWSCQDLGRRWSTLAKGSFQGLVSCPPQI